MPPKLDDLIIDADGMIPTLQDILPYPLDAKPKDPFDPRYMPTPRLRQRIIDLVNTKAAFGAALHFRELNEEWSRRVRYGVELSKEIIAGEDIYGAAYRVRERSGDEMFSKGDDRYLLDCMSAAECVGKPEVATAVYRWEMRQGNNPPTVQYVNLSGDTVKIDIGEGIKEIPQGGEIAVPATLGKWRGYSPPIMQGLAPQLMPRRIECQTCETLIGQADPSGLIVEWVHNAPCGLPCAGRGNDGNHAPHSDRHNNDRECPRCKPVRCPSCAGKGQIGAKRVPSSLWNSTEWRDEPIYCDRCKGGGKVPGLDIWLAEHEQ
jgi:hypothetical protein